MLFFLLLAAARPMPSAEDFKKIQAFTKGMGIKLPEQPLPEKLSKDPLPSDMDAAKLDAAVQALAKAFFVESVFGETINVTLDLFSVPSLAAASVSMAWKSALDAAGKNHLRTLTAEEVESAKTFGRGQVRGGEWSDELKLDARETIVKITGQATVTAPSKLQVLALSAPGQKGSFGAYTVTLLALKGSYVQLRYDGVPIDGELPEPAMLNAAGKRLAVGESQSEALFEGGKKLGEITYEQFKKGPTSTRIYEAVAYGTAVSVKLSRVEKQDTRTVEVSPGFEPKGDEPVTVPRYVAPGAAEPAFSTLDAAKLKAQTKVAGGRVSAMMGFNAPKLYVQLPATGNSAFAKLELEKVKPTLKKKAKWSLQTNGFEGYRQAYTIEADGAKIVDATAIAGVLSLKYPLAMQVVVLDAASPTKDGVSAVIEGNRVAVKAALPDQPSFSSAALEPVRGFDAQGRELRKLNSSSSDGESTTFSFWGVPKSVRVITASEWLEVKVPFNVKPPPLLGDDKKGDSGDH